MIFQCLKSTDKILSQQYVSRHRLIQLYIALCSSIRAIYKDMSAKSSLHFALPFLLDLAAFPRFPSGRFFVHLPWGRPCRKPSWIRSDSTIYRLVHAHHANFAYRKWFKPVLGIIRWNSAHIYTTEKHDTWHKCGLSTSFAGYPRFRGPGEPHALLVPQITREKEVGRPYSSTALYYPIVYGGKVPESNSRTRRGYSRSCAMKWEKHPFRV